jgi:hypothetical protein
MYDVMGYVLGARTELEHRNHLGERIDDEPEPEDLLGVAQPGAQFVQLQVQEVQMTEEAFVQGLGMLPGARQKGS